MAELRGGVEEIRHRLSILDVVSEYVTLKRAGKSYKGLCPFHTEKTPSFTVSEEFQTWHCFGCGEHGDVFSFIMKIENLTFPEAVERLAKRAGVELRRFQKRQANRREILERINMLAVSYFGELLKQTPAALEYLHSRGFTDKTIHEYCLGYTNPTWDGLARYLAAKGVDLADAEQAGLLIRGEHGRYDRFRHRIMFPIFDVQGRVVAFGGRALGDEQPKYLNSPETLLFSKSKSLYGLNVARKSIAEQGYTVLVEGYTDVIAAHQAGFLNCVATLGTALTIDHVYLLSRYAKTIVLAFDSDSAGMKASLRSAVMFHEANCDVKIARLPAGDDPASMLSNGRAEEFASVLRDALPIVDYKLAVLRERYDLGTPEGRAAMLAEAVQVLAEIPTVIGREKYIKGLAGLARWHPSYETGTTLAEDHIRREVERAVRKRSRASAPAKTDGELPTPPNAVTRAESLLLKIIICNRSEAKEVFSSLLPDYFIGDISRKAAESVFRMFGERNRIDLPDLLAAVDDKTGRFISHLAFAELPLLEGKALQDCISLVRNSKLKKLRASEVLRPYMREGIIQTDDSPSLPVEELRNFLRKSGKLPDSSSREGDGQL